MVIVMRFRPIGLLLLFIGLLITPGAFASMVIVEHRLGISSPYRASLALISGLGTLPFVASLMILAFRYPEVTGAISGCLERHRMLFYFVFLPFLCVGVAFLLKWLRS